MCPARTLLIPSLFNSLNLVRLRFHSFQTTAGGCLVVIKTEDTSDLPAALDFGRVPVNRHFGFSLLSLEHSARYLIYKNWNRDPLAG